MVSDWGGGGEGGVLASQRRCCFLVNSGLQLSFPGLPVAHLSSLFTQTLRLTPSSGQAPPNDFRLTTSVLTAILSAGQHLGTPKAPRWRFLYLGSFLLANQWGRLACVLQGTFETTPRELLCTPPRPPCVVTVCGGGGGGCGLPSSPAPGPRTQ